MHKKVLLLFPLFLSKTWGGVSGLCVKHRLCLAQWERKLISSDCKTCCGACRVRNVLNTINFDIPWARSFELINTSFKLPQLSQNVSIYNSALKRIMLCGNFLDEALGLMYNPSGSRESDRNLKLVLSWALTRSSLAMHEKLEVFLFEMQ